MKKWSVVLVFVVVFIGSITAQKRIAFLGVSESVIEAEFTIEKQDVILPFDLDRGMIYVEAAVENNWGQYVLDTGAPSLVLNEKPVSVENNPYIAQSCNAEVNIGVKQVNSFSWAGGKMEQLEAITLDLSHLESAREATVDGMIGYDILKKYTLLLDFGKKELALIKPRSLRKWSERQPLVSIPFVLDGHLPIVEVELNGKLVRLGIDTGAASNLISSDALGNLSNNQEEQLIAEVQGLDQSVKQVVVRQIDQLNSNGFVFSDQFMVLDLSHLKQGNTFNIDGLLGYPFLSQYIVAIDYRRQTLLLWER